MDSLEPEDPQRPSAAAEHPHPPVDFTGTWEIGWPQERFNELKSDPRFHALLTVARLRNFLHFAQGTIVYIPLELSPSARRRHDLNAFFLMNSLLIEAERVINGTGRFFHECPHFLPLAQAVNAPKLRDVIRRCRPLRHLSAFHFFVEGPEEVIRRDVGYFANPPEFIPFLSGHGMRDSSIYADLADLVPFELIIGDMDRTNLKETWLAWLDGASNATADLINALDAFLSRMSIEFGAIQRQAPQSVPDEP